MNNSAPSTRGALPQMPLDCSDEIALMLASDSSIGYSRHERLEHGRAIYRRVRMQLAKEIIVRNWKRTVREMNSLAPDGLAGPAVHVVRR